MKVIQTTIPEILLLKPDVFSDDRGFFYESFNKKTLKASGIDSDFVQDNHSRSVRNVLRGLHYQAQQPQGKLVRVVLGEVFDVAVDVRRSSPTFGRWVGFSLSAANGYIAWIPPGFAHGFLVCSQNAEVIYKCTDYYSPSHERCIRWNDERIGIVWPLSGQPILSGKDAAGKAFSDADYFE